MRRVGRNQFLPINPSVDSVYNVNTKIRVKLRFDGPVSFCLQKGRVRKVTRGRSLVPPWRPQNGKPHHYVPSLLDFDGNPAEMRPA